MSDECKQRLCIECFKLTSWLLRVAVYTDAGLTMIIVPCCERCAGPAARHLKAISAEGLG